MSLVRPHYMTYYGYRWRDAVRAEFWWRVEHSVFYERWHLLNAHRLRKQAEHRGYARRTKDAPRG